MTNANHASIESLRSFAIENGETEFAHLCTAALTEAWATKRIDGALREWGFAPCDEDRIIEIIQNTDTSRPDGAIARGSVEV